MSEKKKYKYYVDLCCFEVEAEDSREAAKIVEEKMKNGELPDINNVVAEEDE